MKPRSYTSQPRNSLTRQISGDRTWMSAGLGVAAGLAAAVGVLSARKLIRTWPRDTRHPLKHRMLDMASGLLQRKIPLESVNTYLNGFHMYADDMGRQVEATHFCTHLAPDLHQCVIYDSNAVGARLIGIEYIISRERFEQLPAEEQQLWHSHHYEIKSGQLTAPGIPEMAEHAYFEDLITTYGKTFHTWQIDRDDFPYGLPQLMMAFTDEGQIDPARIASRDRRLGVSTTANRAARADIPTPSVHPAANSWQNGDTIQVGLENKPFKR